MILPLVLEAIPFPNPLSFPGLDSINFHIFHADRPKAGLLLARLQDNREMHLTRSSNKSGEKPVLQAEFRLIPGAEKYNYQVRGNFIQTFTPKGD